jgi:hypothetical protein
MAHNIGQDFLKDAKNRSGLIFDQIQVNDTGINPASDTRTALEFFGLPLDG